MICEFHSGVATLRTAIHLLLYFTSLNLISLQQGADWSKKASVPKTSSIHIYVLTEHRLVTNRQTETKQTQRRASKNCLIRQDTESGIEASVAVGQAHVM